MSAPADRIRLSVADFGARPDGSDAVPGLRAAAEACRGRSGVTLVIPPGRYVCRDPDAVAAYAEILATRPPMDFPVGPDRDPYRAIMVFVGCRDLRIEAAGAMLEVHGLIQPVEFTDCADAVLVGLGIAWDRDLAEMRARRCHNYRPAVFLHRSRGVVLESVRIHAASGMGLIAQRCTDVRLDRMRVEPAPGHTLSTVCDATHFACCAGLIEVVGCHFAGMGDDAINVHGFYLTVTAAIDGRRVAAECRTSHPQGMVFPVPDPGAGVELVRPDTLLPFATARLGAVVADRRRWTAELEFPAGVPGDLRPGDLVADLGAVPALIFTGNTVRGIRARGALVQTRDALIADNRFERCTGTGIVVDTAMGWCESIGARRVRIHRNRILDCGTGTGTYAGACGIAVLAECPVAVPGVHQDIEIHGNEIAGDGTRVAISVRSARRVDIRGNRANGVTRLLDLDAAEEVSVVDNRLVSASEMPWIHA
ncbi:MAG: alpha,3-galactosidase [Planctomycetota bacterium]|jgi:polygalacturonase